MKKLYLEDDELRNHNYLILCHNIMLSVLKRADRKDWHSFKIDLKEEDKSEWNNHDIEYWRLHGYQEVISKMYYQHTFFSLWADYLSYTYEAVMAAYKMKYSIAYSLLRKPLKDNLFFLELLELRGIDFINKFLKNPIECFAVDKIPKDEKIKVICSVSKDIGNLINGDLIYDIRYSKKFELRFGENMESNSTYYYYTS